MVEPDPGVHVLLRRDAADPGVAGAYVHVHRLTDVPGTGVVAVRPDGYVGFRSDTVDSALAEWLRRVGARTSEQPASVQDRT